MGRGLLNVSKFIPGGVYGRCIMVNGFVLAGFSLFFFLGYSGVWVDGSFQDS